MPSRFTRVLRISVLFCRHSSAKYGILRTMSTQQALYRKYRPATFDEVLGQEHVVQALRAEVAQGTVAHAYLFSGSRGT